MFKVKYGESIAIQEADILPERKFSSALTSNINDYYMIYQDNERNGISFLVIY